MARAPAGYMPVPLSQPFSNGTHFYNATVPNSARAVKFRPTAQSSLSSVTVSGSPVRSGAFSRPIPLRTGRSVIAIRVRTAPTQDNALPVPVSG